MKKILFVGLLMIAGCMVKAQDYKTAIGGRAGSPSGLTVKHFVGGNAALEGLLSLHYGGVELTGLYEIHAPAFQVSRLNWYYGGGAHIASWNGDRHRRFDRYGNFVALGVDGIVGLEYNVSEIPINFSIDLKPTLNFVGYVGFGFDGALSVRYYF